MMPAFIPVLCMRALPLARLLADGEMHTLELLADRLNSEPALIEEMLAELAAAGLSISRRADGGAGIPGGLELLVAERVEAGLTPRARALLTELDLHAAIDSTNTEALRRLEAGAGSGVVISAEQQTAGRGRRGRSWISPFAGNLSVSIIWEFAGGAEMLGGLSLAAGVAVAEALAAAGVDAVQLKWPNDILHGGAKLGGILIETSGGGSGPVAAVLGIGINLRMPAEAAREIEQSWTDVSRLPASPGRNELLAAILNYLLPMLAEFEDRGLSPWRERWSSRDAFAGRQVFVEQGGRRIAGRALGIDARGALRLDTGESVLSFDGGEVSLRVAP